MLVIHPTYIINFVSGYIVLSAVYQAVVQVGGGLVVMKSVKWGVCFTTSNITTTSSI